MEFFKFVEGAIQLDTEGIALYPNIKKILSRDRGGKVHGDPDGRFKLYAFKEFAYVYFKCDYRAYPIQHGLSEKETHAYACKYSELGSDYQPDDLVLQFCKQYEKEHLSPAKSSIRTLIRVFSLNEKIVEKVEKGLKDTLDLPTLNAAQTLELFSYQKQLITVATDVPVLVKKLKEAMNLLEEEERTMEVMRGGDNVLDSMNADNDIET